MGFWIITHKSYRKGSEDLKIEFESGGGVMAQDESL